MKKLLLVSLIFIKLYSFIAVIYSYETENTNYAENISIFDRNEEPIVRSSSDDEFKYIYNFVQLASIGRHEDFPADGNYRLANDIVLPFVAYSRALIESGELETQHYNVEELEALHRLIPDYFRHYYGSDAPMNNVSRGWKPIPEFSGIFDGAGYEIRGLAGDRLRRPAAAPETSGFEQINGLFGVVRGTVKNLTVEIGQEFRNPPGLNMGTTHGSRIAMLNLLAYGGMWYQTENSTSHYIPGVGHVGGVGPIAGIVHGGTIENVYARSLVQQQSGIRDSSIRARERNFGGLVGLVHNGTIRNSGTSVRMESTDPQPAAAGHTGAGWGAGGFSGQIRGNSIIENSSTHAFFERTGNRVGGFVGYLIEGSMIKNSYSKTNFGMMGNATGDHTIVAGFAHYIQSTPENPVRVINSFTTTQRQNSGNRIFDGFSASVSNAIFENVVATAQTSAMVIHIPNEQFNTTFMVDNFLNPIQNIFHVVNEGTEGAYVTFNPEPQDIERIYVDIEGDVVEIAGIDVRPINFSSQRPLRLTKGQFEIFVNIGAQRLGFELTITPEDIQNGDTIYTSVVTFFDSDNELINSVISRVGTLIDKVAPTFYDRVLDGWFTGINDGIRITAFPPENIEVWARFYLTAVIGTTHPGAEITLSESDIPTDVPFDNITTFANESGNFIFTNIPMGIFKLTIRLNGHVDSVESITIEEAHTILEPMWLTVVVVEGITRGNSWITITNLMGELIETMNVGFAGEFRFYGLLDGEFILTLGANGFITRSINFSINRDNLNFNDELNEGIIAMEAVSISGTAKENTRVELWQNDMPIAHVLVGNDGKFIFSALHTDTLILNTVYELRIFLERFDSQRTIMHITGNASQVMHFIQTNKVTISGITSTRATVSLFEGDTLLKRMQSDAFGAFEFVGIQNGYFTLVIERRNFDTIRQDIRIHFHSEDVSRLLLQRAEPNNPHVGQVLQIILVATVLVGVKFLLSQKNETKSSD